MNEYERRRISVSRLHHASVGFDSVDGDHTNHEVWAYLLASGKEGGRHATQSEVSVKWFVPNKFENINGKNMIAIKPCEVVMRYFGMLSLFNSQAKRGIFFVLITSRPNN